MHRIGHFFMSPVPSWFRPFRRLGFIFRAVEDSFTAFTGTASITVSKCGRGLIWS
jgi:hypothetical protein